MKHDDLPPHLRPPKEKRRPLEPVHAELPQDEIPPPPPPRQKYDRDVDPFLRRN